jgi:mannan endo-1,4-beta-mannosidase
MLARTSVLVDRLDFQYFDGGKPAFTDGPNGLGRPGYVVEAPRLRGRRRPARVFHGWAGFDGV